MTSETNSHGSSASASPIGDEGQPRRPTGWLQAAAFAVVFLFACVGGLVFRDRLVRSVKRLVPPAESQSEILYWVSPMDPNVRSDHPAKDSMGMDFVPVYADQQPPQEPVTIEPQLQERNYTTVKVEFGPRVRTIESVGTVAYAEPLVGDVTLKVDAWLEQLSVDYVGQSVNRGDKLFDVYSPELIEVQGEHLINLRITDEARKSDRRSGVESTERNLDSVVAKLKYLDVSDDQIKGLAQDKAVGETLRYDSPFTGIVVEKRAFEGRYIPAGQLLYRIADLSRVWVYVYIYPNQIHCTFEGQGATLTLSELPDREFHGRVAYIYPYLEPKVRAVKVRLEFENPDLVLKPDMFGHVVLEPHQMGTGLNIPEHAVLRTGTRELVYLALPGHHFEAREVQTGMQLDGGMIEVLSGLQEGEELVTSQEFLADSESRLRLLNRKFEPTGMPATKSHEGSMHMHDHAHGAETGNSQQSEPPAKTSP